MLASCLIILVACGENNDSPTSFPLLPPPIVEVQEGDFIYKLYTEKEFYKRYEEIVVITELTYVGGEDSIKVGHAATPFTFSLKEKTNTVKATSIVSQPELTRMLKKDVPINQKRDICCWRQQKRRTTD